jgi:hypothetical protein
MPPRATWRQLNSEWVIRAKNIQVGDKITVYRRDGAGSEETWPRSYATSRQGGNWPGPSRLRCVKTERVSVLCEPEITCESLVLNSRRAQAAGWQRQTTLQRARPDPELWLADPGARDPE